VNSPNLALMGIQVSVVMPCYRAAAFVRRAVESVVAQDYPAIELICVNDGSPDNTLEVLEALKQEFSSRLSFRVIDQPNAGASAARNRGLDLAEGQYIQFLDADDWLLPSKLTSQLALAQEAHPAFVVGSYERVREDGSKLYSRRYDAQCSDRIWSLLLNTNLGITSSNLFRADALRSVGGWNEDLSSSQEYDLMFRLLQSEGTVVFDPSAFTIILHRSQGSISRSDEGANAQRYVDLRLRIREYLASIEDHRHVTEANLALFDALRTLWRYDHRLAEHHYRVHLPAGFNPGVRSGGGKVYSLLLRLAGFPLAERIYSLAGR
jgi:glycosyltransferase involved in cell wall biosynthesis